MSGERASVHRQTLPWIRALCAVLFVVLVATGLYLGYLAYNGLRTFAAHTQFKSLAVIPAPISDQPQSPSTESGAGGPEAVDQPVVAPSKSEIYPDIENKGRVNILFLGIDQRPGETTACRTDTMILVSINPKDMSASLLSIPRDLWVPIWPPNHPEGKINTAHYWGEVDDYPGGGPALAKHTVRYNLGVPVHYYVRLNFTGFEQIIDTIGGIDIEVPQTIDDYQYPNSNLGYEHLHIDAGWQHFDGETALKYARTRKGTGDGDFSRMDRQQQVIFAVRDKVLSLPNLPQLVLQLPQVVRDLGNSLETDIPLEMMPRLASWAQQIQKDSIRRDILDRRVTTEARTSDDQQVLIYDREKARPIIEALFSDSTPEAPVVETAPADRLETESARVAVYNGTGIPELAGRIAAFLQLQGIDVIRVDNADHFDYPHTVVTIYANKPFTEEWLSSWLTSLDVAEPEIRTGVDDQVDLEIIIGKDFPTDRIP